mmetsp:Transcript_34731/g.35427  ORF Transcript_34731/g.35427 Transcript_34731/m.35427 type:complete len:375 (+) Transcript_34731:93-1217(+)
MVATGPRVGLAFGLTIGAGLATCLGGLVIFSKRLIHLTSPASLSLALSASAGVMLFISFVELYTVSVEQFTLGLGIKNEEDDEVTCDHICNGNSWLLATICFMGGVALIFFLDWILHYIAPGLHHDITVDELCKLQDIIVNDKDPLESLAHKEKEKEIKQGSKEDNNNTNEGGGDIELNLSSPSSPTNENNRNTNQSTEDLIKLAEKEEQLKAEAIAFKIKLNKTGIVTCLALTIHNIPEGIATYVAAMDSAQFGGALAIGIALHNIPEGIAVAAPVYFATGSRWKGLLWTLVSAFAEPFGGIIGWLVLGDSLDHIAEAVMFGIVAGIMVAISLNELLPTARDYDRESKYVGIGTYVGMSVMAASFILFGYGDA